MKKKKHRGRPKGYHPLPISNVEVGIINSAAVITAWRERKERRGLPPTDDKIWAKINELWPTFPKEDLERIFEIVTGKPYG